jgi:hypothetical protein
MPKFVRPRNILQDKELQTEAPVVWVYAGKFFRIKPGAWGKNLPGIKRFALRALI